MYKADIIQSLFITARNFSASISLSGFNFSYKSVGRSYLCLNSVSTYVSSHFAFLYNGCICSIWISTYFRRLTRFAKSLIHVSPHSDEKYGGVTKPYHLRVKQQGFVDQYGTFLSREEAWVIADREGQIRMYDPAGHGPTIPRVANQGDKQTLFSEDLY